MIGRALKYMERFLWLIAIIALLSWSITTIEASRYQEQSTRALDLAISSPAANHAPHDWLGRLEIPRLDLSTIVLEGDDTSTLKLGIGHVPGTAIPGLHGNAALAGHRDTFFRSLRDVRVGDEIRWTSPEYFGRYRVESTRVVSPTDLDVLDSSDDSTLTLITCYPFNAIGPAPERFIVRAQRIQ